MPYDDEQMGYGALPDPGMGGPGVDLGMEEEVFPYEDDVVQLALDSVGHAPDVPNDWDVQNPYLVDEGVAPAEEPVEDTEMLEAMPGDAAPVNALDRIRETLLQDYSDDVGNSMDYQDNAMQASAAERKAGRMTGL